MCIDSLAFSEQVEVGLPESGLSSVLSRPWNQASMITTAEKSTCAPETWIFFNCPGQENTIVKYISYLKAKNGTDYIITYCR